MKSNEKRILSAENSYGRPNRPITDRVLQSFSHPRSSAFICGFKLLCRKQA